MIAAVLIIGSIQLLILGVFGEYLGRMYMETKRRPLFIVREVRGSPAGLPDASSVAETKARPNDA